MRLAAVFLALTSTVVIAAKENQAALDCNKFSQGSCPKYMLEHEGSCYKFHQDRQELLSAKTRCLYRAHKLGFPPHNGALISIKSQDINDIARCLIPRNTKDNVHWIHLGGYKWQGTQWRWFDDESKIFNGFNNGEDFVIDENNLHLKARVLDEFDGGHGQLQWHDTDSSKQENWAYYICRYWKGEARYHNPVYYTEMARRKSEELRRAGKPASWPHFEDDDHENFAEL